MPWSEWQDGKTGIVSFSKYAVAWLNRGGTFFNGWFTVPTNAIELYAEVLEESESDNPYGPVETIEAALYFTVGDSWKANRDYLPNLLATLTEGVDYGIRPDRTEADRDAYVEYEDGDSAITEEFKPLLRYESGSIGGGPEAARDGDGLWELGYTANPTLPVEESDGAEFSVETWPALGTVFASGGVEATNTSHSAEFPAGFSTANAIRVAATMSGTPPLVPPEGAPGSAAAASARFTIGAPSFRYQMPRWRYWIPGAPPLRQFPRNDGRRGGAPSARPTSRQGTTARRTYF
jgi:hypothetical protein